MAELSATTWKTHKLVWKSWGEEFVVFNLASGNTHLLSPVAAQALKALEQRPSNAHDLSHQLAATANLTSDAELIQHVEQLLTSLEELGLIEPSGNLSTIAD